jgi:hypothetical protein
MGCLILAVRDFKVQTLLVNLSKKLKFSLIIVHQFNDLVTASQSERDYFLVCELKAVDGIHPVNLSSVIQGASKSPIIISNLSNNENLRFLGNHPNTEHLLTSSDLYFIDELTLIVESFFVNNSVQSNLNTFIPTDLKTVEFNSSSQIDDELDILENKVRGLAPRLVEIRG